MLSLIAAIVGTQSIVSFSKTPRLTEEQRIVHVLNRLGFGPRPGDVERIKSIGLENYINQQLAPEKIADTLAENKTQDLSALKLSTAELYEKYPQPAQLIRRMQDRGMLPKELSDAQGRSEEPAGESRVP